MLKKIGFGLLLGILNFAPGLSFAAPNKAPTVTLTAPKSGDSFTTPATISLSATAADADGTVSRVQFYQGTTLIGSVTSPPYNYTWSNMAAGTYSISAKATDNVGAVTTSTAVSITVVTIAPKKVQIIAPLNGATIAGDSIVVSGTYVGDMTTSLWVDNGNSTRQATTPDGSSFSATLPLYLGANTFNVTVARRDKTSETATVNVTGVAAPTVAFSLPTKLVYDAPADVEIAAAASSSSGTIQYIDLLNGATSLGRFPGAAAAASLKALGQGTYTITANTLDSVGLTATNSKTITVLAPNSLPIVSITSPSNGAKFDAPATVTVVAAASDTDGQVSEVDFYLDGIIWGATNVPPYTLNRTITAIGNHTISAKAIDNRGGISDSLPLNITINTPNQPPTVAITSPVQGGTFTAYSTISLVANASDADGAIAKVTFSQGATVLGSVTSAPFKFDWVGVAPGNYSVTATALDSGGATTVSSPVSITVNSGTPAAVTLTSPVNGSTYIAPANISLTANAVASSGAIINKVEFYQGTSMIGVATLSPYSVNWANVASGAYQLSAKVFDSRSLSATSIPISISVAPAPLTSTITSPPNNTTITAPGIVPITINANSGSSTITKLELFDGTALITTLTPDAAYNSFTFNYNWNVAAPGSHALTAKVTDSLNVTTVTNVVTVQVNVPLTPPTVSLSANPIDSVAPATISLSADITNNLATIAKVEFFQGTVLLSTINAAPYTFVWNGVPANNYVITAKATDTSGVVGTSNPVPVAVTAPGLFITAPLDGSFIDGDSVVISGTIASSPNTGVTVNGAVAGLDDDNHFYASIPLTAGANTVEIVMTTQAGGTTTRNLTLDASGVAFPLQVSVDRVQGFTPHLTNFDVFNPSDQDVTLRIDNGAPTVLHPGANTNYALSMNSAGAARVEFVASDSQGRSFKREYAVVANDIDIADQKMKLMLREMSDAVVADNLPLAMSYLNEQAQYKYGPVFKLLQPEFQDMLATWSTPVRGSITNNIAEYAIFTNKNNVKNLFLIYFVKSPDGVWHLDSM